MEESGITIITDVGKGRPFILVSEQGEYSSYSQSLFEVLSKSTRAILVEAKPITELSWKSQSERLLELIHSLGIRQASFVGFGPACALVENVCLRELKIVRTACFIDISAHPHPTFWSNIIDKFEEKLPMGLPLRATSKNFDGRSFLQRIRCPSIVVLSSRATSFIRKHAHEIVRALPTAWLVELSSDKEIEHLKGLIEEFQDVPAKCPQKGSARSHAP